MKLFRLKYLVVLITLASAAAIIYGFVLKDDDPQLANKWIGSGTLGLFLLAMPLFLYKESKGKQMKDYLLSEENIRKMREKQGKSPENQ